MTQKTLRFYDDSEKDRLALMKLSNYKNYGFVSEREMLMEAINAFGETKSGIGSLTGSIDVDYLANQISKKILSEISVMSISSDSKMTSKNAERIDITDKTPDLSEELDFIENLL